MADKKISVHLKPRFDASARGDQRFQYDVTAFYFQEGTDLYQARDIIAKKIGEIEPWLFEDGRDPLEIDEKAGAILYDHGESVSGEEPFSYCVNALIHEGIILKYLQIHTMHADEPNNGIELIAKDFQQGKFETHVFLNNGKEWDFII